MKRAEFKKATIKIIASRSGYRCNYPDCNVTTIGPGASAIETASIGTAAHIYSASSRGPRSDGGLSEEELISVNNGIWLCENHGKLIDTNRGKLYPPNILLSYKNYHEAKIAKNIQGVSFPVGWIEEFKVNNSPIFSKDQFVRFARLTLVMGKNATGKSALCNWLTGFSNHNYLRRWTEYHFGNYPIITTLTFRSPIKVQLQLQIEESGRVSYKNGENPIPLVANPIKILCPKSYKDFYSSKTNDLQMFASILDIEESEVMNLAAEIQNYKHTKVKNIEFKKNEEGGILLHSDVEGTVKNLPFCLLASTEKEFVIIEFVTVIARIYAQFMPTLLIIDSSISMYNTWFEYYENHFNDPNNLFQTLLVITDHENLDLVKITWRGWGIVRTVGEIPNITIEKSV